MGLIDFIKGGAQKQRAGYGASELPPSTPGLKKVNDASFAAIAARQNVAKAEGVSYLEVSNTHPAIVEAEKKVAQARAELTPADHLRAREQSAAVTRHFAAKAAANPASTPEERQHAKSTLKLLSRGLVPTGLEGAYLDIKSGELVGPNKEIAQSWGAK